MANILFLCPDILAKGGIARASRMLTAALGARDGDWRGDVVVLSLNDSPGEPLPIELGGLEHAQIRCFAARRWQFVWDSCVLARTASVIVYGHLGFAPLVFLHRAVNRHAQRVLLLHGVEAWHYRSAVHSLGRRVMTRIVAVSRHTLDRFCDCYHVSSETPTQVIPLAVSPHLMPDPGTGAKVTSDGRLVMLTVTRLSVMDRSKGVDDVLRSLPALLKEFPTLVYVVAGGGDDRERLESLARATGVGHAVQFLGWVSEDRLAREFQRCDIYVMPSAKEGFGLVFVEAMAHGKPVVAAREGATPEVVEDGKTGILVGHGDVPGLAAALTCLLRSPGLRSEMGASGREVVRRKFTFPIFAGRWRSLLSAA